MQDTEKSLIQKLIANRTKRRKIGLILCALSLSVVAGVFWYLRITGITMTDEACCGKIEHTHTEECIAEKRLICGFAEEINHSPDKPQIICQMEEHTHDGPCYTTEQILICAEDHEHNNTCYTEQQVLICTKPEHTHDNSCMESCKQKSIAEMKKVPQNLRG